MVESQRTITYEVQVLRGSRWEISSHFDEKDRHMALTRARALTRHPDVPVVRVVKEIYDPGQDGTEEFVIYKSRRTDTLVRPQPPAKASRRRRSRRLGWILAAPPPLGVLAAGLLKAIVTSPHWSVLPRALVGTAASFLAAVLVTGMTAHWLDGGRPSFPAATRGFDIATLLAIFSCVFLFGALMVAFMLTAAPRHGFPASSPQRRLRSRSPRPGTAPTRPPAHVPAEAEPPTRLSQKTDELCKQVADYLQQAIQPARGAYDLKDSYIRFGVNLFVAGACDTLCQEHEIEASAASAILAAGLQAVGVDADHAALLTENYIEYLVSDGRYMAMFGCGREAITAHLAARADAADLLLRALDGWTQAHGSPDTRPVVTVMFTRLIGFEEWVGARGDEAARQAIRVHNQIVDRRLAEFHGKRIKHLHDGTMAAFMTAATAVRAAHAICADFAEQAHHFPERDLTLSIGLNCGEPITEKNDLFGASVQLAARIVGVAEAGQILVSEAVRERLVAELPTMTFTACGAFPLKGFGDPVPLYEPARI